MPHRTLKKCDRSFFQRDAKTLARDLIGALLVHRTGRKEYRARIVETEAYVGPHDLASHSSKGRTKRNEVMFGPAGHAYVYFIYGTHEMFNIVAGKTGSGQAVLIRAAEPLNSWEADLSGPGKLARAFKITRDYNGLDLTGDKLFLLHDPERRPRIVRTKRIGCDFAGEWKDKLLRFLDADSKAVSDTYRKSRAKNHLSQTRRKGRKVKCKTGKVLKEIILFSQRSPRALR